MTKYLRKFFNAGLTYQISILFVIGLCLGLVFRNFPNLFLPFGLDVAKLKILGIIFIKLIKMIVAPLIFFSVSSAILSVNDNNKATSLAIKTVAMFIFLTCISVGLGMAAVKIIKPGYGANIDKESLMASSRHEVKAITSNQNAHIASVDEFLLNIIPSNIFHSFVHADFLQIIFFATIFAFATMRNRNYNATITSMINMLNEITLDISRIAVQFAPYGIFGITAWLFGTQELVLLKSLGLLIISFYGSCLFLMYVIYSLIALYFRINPLPFFRKIFSVQAIAYLTASSSATLPFSLALLNDKMGVTKQKANFVIPLGATVNMNGGAIHLAMSTIFIAQLFNVDLTITQHFTVFFLAVLGAIGTAPIPGVSIFLLAGLLSVVGLPMDAVAIILAVDRLLDMARTVTNVTGDLFTAVIIDKTDNTLDMEKYHQPL